MELVVFVLVVLFLVLVGPLALVLGADSRVDDVARQRRWHG